MSTLQIPLTFSLGLDILDTDTDLLKIEIPDPTNVNVNKVSLNSLSDAVGTPTIECRNTSSGLGEGITVQFVDGEDFAENTGTLSITDSIWIRSGTPGNLSHVNGIIRYNYTG